MKPQTTNHKPQTTNHKPQTILILTILILLSFRQLQSQNTGVPYDPCPPAFYELDTRYCSSQDLRKCTYYGEGQFPCSPGYCFEDSPTFNGGIPYGGTVTGVNIEITGTYFITQNVVFKNCIFKMHGGSKIIVSPGSTSTIYVEFNGCTFFGCNQMWYGISTENTQNSNLFFDFKGCWVEDAYTGLELEEGAYNHYYIVGSTFNNNFIGIGNKLKNDTPLNAVIAANLFTVAAKLASNSVGNLPSMPGHPAPKAGVSFEHTTAKVGGLASKNATISNTFTCLYQGIYAEDCILSSENNYFAELRSDGYGIKAIKGNIRAISNNFGSAGRNAIDCDGASLYAEKNNFSGNTETGIFSYNNLNAQTIIIRNENQFEMNTDRWMTGININRSLAVSGVHSQVVKNIFIITNGNSPDGIYATENSIGSTDIMKIDSNIINIGGASPATTVGINVDIKNSNNVWIRHNTIHFSTVWSDHSMIFSYGIRLQPVGGISIGQLSVGHKVRGNIITGIDIGSFSCGAHVTTIKEVEFCDNYVDYSLNGLHFKGFNNVDLRENKFHNHDYGLKIDGSTSSNNGHIGLQEGKGNTWSTNANDCVVAAAGCYNCMNPLFSSVTVKESNLLPYLPPANKIIASPTPTQWVYYDVNAILHYCEPETSNLPVIPLRIYPLEQMVINGTSNITGTALWDFNFQIYNKLLTNPSLRPVGSNEDTYFNTFAGSFIANLGQIYLNLNSAASMPIANDQQLTSDYYSIKSYWEALSIIDDNANLSAPPTLASGFYGSRFSLLQSLSATGLNTMGIEQIHQTQVNAALSNALAALTFTTPITTQETANKFLFEIGIRKAAGLPIPQNMYLQILSLANQSEMQVGNAAYLAIGLLGLCDQITFRYAEEPTSGRSNDQKKNIGSNVLSKDSLVLFPNPTLGLVEVNIPHDRGGIIQIYNSIGALVFTQTIPLNQSTSTIDLSKISVGSYRIVFLDASGQAQPLTATLLKF